MAKEYYISLQEMTQFRALSGAARVDAEAGIIYGASVMAIGPALGHGLDIDREGLEQCLAACKARGEAGVKIMFRHDGEMEDLVAVAKNFRIEGDKNLCDIHLLNEAPQRARILELAIKMPESFGLSVETFPPEGGHKPVPGSKRMLYRCESISAIALVPEPAANKTGFFEKNPPTKMDPEEIKEAVVAAVAEAVAPIEERLSKLEEGKDDEEKTNAGEGEDKDKKTDLSAKSIADAVERGVNKVMSKFASKLGTDRPPAAADPAGSRNASLTKFEAKAEELTKMGVRNPTFVAAQKYPELYREYREKLERGEVK